MSDELDEPEAPVKVKRYKQLKTELKAITANHQVYINNLYSNRLTLCSGKAGTGKTFIAMGVAADLFNKSIVKKIIITRPLVECGSKFGALPGDIDGKTGPYMFPIYDALGEFFGDELTKKYVEDKKIIVCPLEFMRGSSFRDSFIILDEAQNATKKQLKMFLTRFTKTCRVVLTGDAEQSDLTKLEQENHYSVAMRKLENVDDLIGIVRLTKEDQVRDELITLIDEALGEEFN